MRRLAALTVCAGFGMLLAASARAGELAIDWLDRMSVAMNQMSYQGTFVYHQEDRMETMRITHVSDENGVRERLVSLSGGGGEMLRDANGVSWVLGDGSSVMTDGSFQRPLFPLMPSEQEGLAAHSYEVGFAGKSLVAGHLARKIKVEPRDHYRFGYALWLEAHSGLLLKWELLDPDRKPLARLMFTEIRLGSEVDPGELKPARELNRYQAVETGLPAGGSAISVEPRWAPVKIPPGFKLTAHRFQDGGEDDGGEYEHLVYSDGLAAVSVYIEDPAGDADRPERIERHGTTHAFTKSTGGRIVTVVGDVPAATVLMIGKSVEPATVQ